MSKKLLPLKDMIYEIRGHQVMLDADLAKIYQVETKRLNEAVRRNKERFPSEFMFQLKEKEYDNLRSQIATSSLRSQFAISKDGYGGRRYLPFAFTEHGVIMLSSVLNSKIATKINIAVVKAFIDKGMDLVLGIEGGQYFSRVSLINSSIEKFNPFLISFCIDFGSFG